MKINMLRDILNTHRGQFVSVTFNKEDGTERTLSGKVAIPTGEIQRKTKQTQAGDTILTLSVPEGYRTVRLDRILSVRCAGLDVQVAK